SLAQTAASPGEVARGGVVNLGAGSAASSAATTARAATAGSTSGAGGPGTPSGAPGGTPAASPPPANSGRSAGGGAAATSARRPALGVCGPLPPGLTCPVRPERADAFTLALGSGYPMTARRFRTLGPLRLGLQRLNQRIVSAWRQRGISHRFETPP